MEFAPKGASYSLDLTMTNIDSKEPNELQFQGNRIKMAGNMEETEVR